MQTFGIPPSRPVGDIKNTIRDAILDGIIHNDRNEAWKLMIDTGINLGLKALPGYENPLPIDITKNED
jgi:poly(A) polymerase